MTLDAVTDDQIVEIGSGLSRAVKSLQSVQEMSAKHGAIVGGLLKVKAVQHLRSVLANPVAEAILIDGAGICYEVAESKDWRMSNSAKFVGVTQALEAGYLLNDPRGLHFCIFEAKNGAVTVMAKRAGLMHKLAECGATEIDSKAVVVESMPRATDNKKLDAVVEAEASCMFNGKRYVVERRGEFAYRLPCNVFDLPDKNIAQGRRRVLRDLLELVSGERVYVSGDDIESLASVTVANTSAGALPDDTTKVSQNVWSQQWHAAQKRIRDEGQLSTFNAHWAAVEQAATKEALRAVWSEIKGSAKYLGQNNVDELLRYAEFRGGQIND